MARPNLPESMPVRMLLGSALAVLAIVALDAIGPSPERVADRGLIGPIGTLQAKAGAAWTPMRVDVGADRCPEATAALARGSGPVRPGARCELRGEQLVLLAADGAELATSRSASARSLLGPLLAVFLVLLLRRPATALVVAVVAATLVGKPPLEGLSNLAVVGRDTLIGGDNQLVLLFTVAMLGMVHVGIDSGAYAALAARMSGQDGQASPRRARVATVLLGLLVFFDDYANSLVVGGSMRDTCDRAGVSREKLAYLVDATSASVAGVALVSTWVGFEVGLLGDFASAFDGISASGYGTFLALLPYRFYCLLTIVAALYFAWSGRAFGPMLRAEERARAAPVATESSTRRDGRLRDALLPVAVVLAVVLGADLWAGRGAEGGLVDVFVAGADAVGLKALAVGGVLGSALAAGLARSAGMAWREVGRSWWSGVAGMAPILVILVAAMAMRSVTSDAGAPGWIAAGLGHASGATLPLASFAVAAGVAFLTGSSWATMGILLPVVVPLMAPYAAQEPAWLLAATAAVLDGAIFGDHCSPLSDTTVMSSAAAGVSHDAHVWTQIPYAVLVMGIAGLCGYVGTAFWGLAAWQAMVLGSVALVLAGRGIGRIPRTAPPNSRNRTEQPT
ncbi:MAG: hypothetical protein RIT45_2851 [Pseudomonadota bacterium]|jgi:Na+/H+ antiporter NhaC